MARGCYQDVSALSVRSRWWAVPTMIARKDTGGERRERLLWMSGIKVSEFES